MQQVWQLKKKLEKVLRTYLKSKQIETYKSTKAKINPCEQTPELCSKIKFKSCSN